MLTEPGIVPVPVVARGAYRVAPPDMLAVLLLRVEYAVAPLAFPLVVIGIILVIVRIVRVVVAMAVMLVFA
jgi:hypothetical protein